MLSGTIACADLWGHFHRLAHASPRQLRLCGNAHTYADCHSRCRGTVVAGDVRQQTAVDCFPVDILVRPVLPRADVVHRRVPRRDAVLPFPAFRERQQRAAAQRRRPDELARPASVPALSRIHRAVIQIQKKEKI